MGRYMLWKSIWKGTVDGVKTAIAADAVLITLADPEQVQTHVTAIVTGAVSGVIRGIVNWWKNRKK